MDNISLKISKDFNHYNELIFSPFTYTNDKWKIPKPMLPTFFYYYYYY